MNATYDHIVAIVLIGAIFVGTVVAVPAAISFANFQAVDQQQLRNTTLNVFNAMLLTPGTPSNWGSKFSLSGTLPDTFGLAYPAQFSKYILDPYKIQQLDNRSIMYITYDEVRALLNLQNYGFKFSLFRPFRVGREIEWGQNQVFLEINTTRTEDNAPIPNAQITTTIIATARHLNEEEPLSIVNEATTHYTNITGQATIIEQVNVPNDYWMDSALAIINVNVNGMETVVVAQRKSEEQEFLNINTFGDDVTLTFRGQFMNETQGARRVNHIYGFDFNTDPDDLMDIYNGSDGNADKINAGTSEFEYWNNTFSGLSALDPAILLFVLRVPNPTRLVLVAGPLNYWDADKVFEVGPDDPNRNVLATMRRLVVVSDMTYIASLVLWEE